MNANKQFHEKADAPMDHSSPSRGRALLGVALLMLAVPAWANDASPHAAPPQLPAIIDPGAQRERTREGLLEREREREREAEERREDVDPVEAPPGPHGGNLPEADDAFMLLDIRFSDSVFLEPAFLETVAAGYIGRSVTFSELNRMLARINERYRERGLVTAAAYIPPQTIGADGVLQVELLEGRLGRLYLEGLEYTSRGYLHDRLPLATGEVIDVPTLRQAIQRINRHTALALQADIRPGDETGESDITITVAEPPRYSVQTFIDNAGSENTGEWRGGLITVLNGPFRRADRLTAYGVYARGSRNGVLQYEVPVNRWGGRVDLTHSEGRIRVIDGPFEELNITGKSKATAIALHQPFYAGPRGIASARVGYSVSQSTSEIDGVAISDFDIDETELRLDWSGGTGERRWRINQGVVHADVEALDAASETFKRYPGSASWLQWFSQRWAARLQLGWQYTSEDALPSSLVYQLGGATTVRGYEEGVVSGAKGYRASLNVDYHWRPGLRQTLFMDHGEVDQGVSGREDLNSVGTGINWRPTSDLDLDLNLGIPLDDVVPDQDDYRFHVRLTWVAL